MMGFLVAIPKWHEPSQNLHLLEAFQITDTRALPMLLVFTELPSGQIVQLRWRFEAGENEAECLKSLTTVVKAGRAAINAVTDDHVKSNEEVFYLIKNAHVEYKIMKGLKAACSVGKWVKELVATFQGA